MFFTCLKQIFYCLLQSPPIWFHLNMSIYNWHWTSYWPDCESLQPFHTGWDQTFWSNSPRNQSLRIPYIRNRIKSIYHNVSLIDLPKFIFFRRGKQSNSSNRQSSSRHCLVTIIRWKASKKTLKLSTWQSCSSRDP